MTLSGISFTADDLGTHSYTLREVESSAGGVGYSSATYAVTATVADDGAGHLTVTWNADEKDEQSYEFVNTYAAAPATVSPVVGKTLSGRSLSEGEFTFKLSGEGTELVATNDAAGQVRFATLSFSKVGTYSYKIAEVAGNAAHVSYDTAEHTLVVTVTDEREGHLVASASYDGGEAAPVFANSYDAPQSSGGSQTGGSNGSNGSPTKGGKKGSAMPQASDATDYRPAIACALAGAGLLVAGLVGRRRRGSRG